ncbi:MAG: hypothetical protein WC455_26980 [Dehalococcoidia bacterium]|jgi:hypothetical protein
MRTIFTVPLTKSGQLDGLPDLAYEVNGHIPDGTGYSLLEEIMLGMTSVKVYIDTSAEIVESLKKIKNFKHLETLPEPEIEPVDDKVVKAVYEVLDKFTTVKELPQIKAAMDVKLGVKAVDGLPN